MTIAQRKDWHPRPLVAERLFREMAPNNRRAAYQLGCSLEDTENEWAWRGFGAWLEELVVAETRIGIAQGVLGSLKAGDAERVCEDVCRYAGHPPPRFVTARDDARWWVGKASLAERKAYGFMCFQSYSDADKQAFLDRVTQCRRDGA